MFENLIPTQKIRQKIIKSIAEEFDFVKVGKIGDSVCGRSIDLIQLGSVKKSTIWVGAHHGLEWITSLLLFEFFYDICKKIKFSKNICGIDVKLKLENRGVAIIPCLNPDGVEIALNGFKSVPKITLPIKNIKDEFSAKWQSNANGVDLNHNYNAGWEELHRLEQNNKISSPGHTRYGGKMPESEPETKALTDFCRKNNFEYALAFHSQGEEIYWDYGEHTPESAEKFAEIFALMSGYNVSEPEGLAVGGGFKDWFIEEFGRPAFTIEVGYGKNPLPLEEFPKIYNKIKKALYFCALV
ncbi:MAG: M14 family metallocarboxypeptidase [Clostridia bacterium]|nr:M14 family metallocarboxypeptidase [Clostridia bacterium]